MATKAKRLEVFDFKKDEEPQIQPRKHFPKLGNPDHDAMWKYQFIECVAPGSDAVDMKSESDESINENSPSSPALDAPESGATLSGHASINGFSDSETACSRNCIGEVIRFIRPIKERHSDFGRDRDRRYRNRSPSPSKERLRQQSRSPSPSKRSFSFEDT